MAGLGRVVVVHQPASLRRAAGLAGGDCGGVAVLALSLYLALAMALCARWRRTQPWPRRSVVRRAVAGAEWRAPFFTGFPWAASGYAQVDAPLAALAPWIGVSGIGAYRPRCCGAVVARPGADAGRGGVGACWCWAAGARQAARSSAARRHLSGEPGATNVAQDQKFATAHVPQHWPGWRGRSTVARQLVVAPETAVPLLPSQLGAGAGLLAGAGRALCGRRQAALIGVPLGDYDPATPTRCSA